MGMFDGSRGPNTSCSGVCTLSGVIFDHMSYLMRFLDPVDFSYGVEKIVLKPGVRTSRDPKRNV